MARSDMWGQIPEARALHCALYLIPFQTQIFKYHQLSIYILWCGKFKFYGYSLDLICNRSLVINQPGNDSNGI